MKKSAALLITLLIVSSLGLMALVVGKSAVLALIVNTRNTDGVIAEELARGGIEYGLMRCTATTDAIEMGSPQDPNYHKVLGDGQVDIWIAGHNTGVNRTCQIVANGWIRGSYKRHELSYSGAGVPPVVPEDNTAYLFLGWENVGRFFSISSQMAGDYDFFVETQYISNNSGAPGSYTNWPVYRHFAGSPIDWPRYEATIIRRISQGTVRVLNSTGALVGILHIYREDPSGTISYPGLPGVKLVDEGRFVDSTIAAENWDNILAYSMVGLTRKKTDLNEWYADLVRSGDRRTAEETFNYAIAKYNSEILPGVHFLVAEENADQTTKLIKGRLFGYSNDTQLGEFQGSAVSESHFFPDFGAENGTLYVTATGEKCINPHPFFCVAKFLQIDHPNFRYKLVP